MPVKVTTSNLFLTEKKYVLDFLFGQGYKLNIESSENPYYTVTTPNGSRLEIADAFFAACKNLTGMYTKSVLPGHTENNFETPFSTQNIFVLYGRGKVSKTEGPGSLSLRCEADIIGSIFFMLSRWEEYLPQEYDRFGRIIPSNNMAVKLGFSRRPVVDEWRVFIWDLLEKLDPSVKRPPAEGYRLNPTHDVDILYFPTDVLNMLGDVKNTRNPAAPIKRFIHKIKGTNPYNTFDFLMDMSERRNVPSVFYFMADGKSKLDNKYRSNDPFLKELVAKVRKRGHCMGLHPGFSTFNDVEEFIRQKEYVEDYTGQKITHNRQHYLRLRLPETLNVWEKAGIENDSSLGFTDGVGYRCGTGGSFPLFHVTERRTTNVVETPLTFMEVALRNYADLPKSRSESLAALRLFKAYSKKYQTPFTFLFHNSSFDDIRWPGWQKLYHNFLSEP